jgi:hypothetical protein
VAKFGPHITETLGRNTSHRQRSYLLIPAKDLQASCRAKDPGATFQPYCKMRASWKLEFELTAANEVDDLEIVVWLDLCFVP